MKTAPSRAHVATQKVLGQVQHTNLDPRRTKAPSTLAFEHSIALVPLAGNGKRVASALRASQAQPGRFHVGVPLRRSLSMANPRVRLQGAAAKRTRNIARLIARRAMAFWMLISGALQACKLARRLHRYLLPHRWYCLEWHGPYPRDLQLLSPS